MSMILVVINAAVYFLQLVMQLSTNTAGQLERYLALTPVDLFHGWIWQLLTFQFLHGGPLHLILNCVMLYMFGRSVEEIIGRMEFLKLYLISGAIGGLLQATLGWLFPIHFGYESSTLGASAGVFALVAAFAALHWEQHITTLVAFVIPVTMRAKYLLLVMGILSGFGMLEKGSGIAHAAHLGGMLAGLGYIRMFVQGGRGGAEWDWMRRRSEKRELVNAGSGRVSVRRVQPQKAEELPPEEFISKEVDPILDKISQHGIHSLTDQERTILEKARKKMSKR